MKKINANKAGSIVGGTISKDCTSVFNMADGKCMETITCTDKNGKVVYEKTSEVGSEHCNIG